MYEDDIRCVFFILLRYHVHEVGNPLFSVKDILGYIIAFIVLYEARQVYRNLLVAYSFRCSFLFSSLCKAGLKYLLLIGHLKMQQVQSNRLVWCEDDLFQRSHNLQLRTYLHQ
jgi:hypothetical protein